MAEVVKESKDGDGGLQYIGVDLSYSVNKKSYNLLKASKLDEFLKSEKIGEGVKSVTELVSFGDDRYGLKYTTSSGSAIAGFSFEHGDFHPLLESTIKELDAVSPSAEDIVLSNTASGQEAVLFNNKQQIYTKIDLFDPKSKNAKTFSSDEDHDDEHNQEADKQDGGDQDKNGDDEEETKKENGADQGDGDEDEDGNGNEEDAESGKNGKASSKLQRKKSGSTEPKFKVKSSIRRVFKHLLLTANGSLYGLQKAFHKKYFAGNSKIVEVECDGSRCMLCLDENGVLWSFGINMFGKLGLKRNDKKQVYTNPREIALFKAYKVRDFGITNRCCVAVCANGNVYGWGSFSKDLQGTDSDIWYTPQLLSSHSGNKRKWRVFSGFRFMMLLDEDSNELFVCNTEFGFTVREEAKHGLLIRTQQLKLPENVKVSHVIASSESAIIVVNAE